MNNPADNVRYLFGNPEQLTAQPSEQAQLSHEAAEDPTEGLIEDYADLIRAEEEGQISPEVYGLHLSYLYDKATKAGLSETDMARACGSAMTRLEKEKNNSRGQQIFPLVLRLEKE